MKCGGTLPGQSPQPAGGDASEAKAGLDPRVAHSLHDTRSLGALSMVLTWNGSRGTPPSQQPVLWGVAWLVWPPGSASLRACSSCPRSVARNEAGARRFEEMHAFQSRFLRLRCLPASLVCSSVACLPACGWQIVSAVKMSSCLSCKSKMRFYILNKRKKMLEHLQLGDSGDWKRYLSR